MNTEITFADLGMRQELQEAVTKLGYSQPTPIQAEAIPTLIAGNDVLAQAATGTGKTAAFALPILQSITPSDHGPQALILTPTRELAIQVAEAISGYGQKLGAKVVAVYGGQPIDRQLRAMRGGVDVVVATPGRAIDHLKRRSLRLDHVRMVVLDEADEMLDMGFAEELDEILSKAPKERQTALFSATMPPRIQAIANSHLKNPQQIRIAKPKQIEGEAPQVRQSAYMVSRVHKVAAMGRVLDMELPTAAIVFCRTRDQVDQLTSSLNGRGHRAEALHGGMNQEQRDKVMNRVRKGVTHLLIATDVAARGLDIDQLTHVVNYDVPTAAEAYVHRIGRVGRAGRAGIALTFFESREQRSIKNIERITKQKISIETLPSVKDVKAKRLERTQVALEASLEDPSVLEPYRNMVDNLGERHDLVKVAMAAIHLAHQARGMDQDDVEIPEPFFKAERPGGDRFSSDRKRPGAPSRTGRFDKSERFDKSDRSAKVRRPSANMARLYIGVGKSSGVRPQDLVGAIANESNIPGRDIGGIDIADRFSIVEVPEAVANDVISAMKKATIKGNRANIRRDRGRQ